jgi:polar amino acid transport system substrate-binding protein
MKLNLQLRACLFLAGLLATPAGLLNAEAQAAQAQGALRVGVAPNMPPMIFKEGKDIVGMEADLAQALGRELGRSIVFVELPWPDLLDALEANKIDIVMSSMSVTRARQARVNFSEPYLRVGQMALVRADSRGKLLGTGLANHTVGVQKATTSDMLVMQEFPKAKRKYFESGDEAAKALAKKKIDLYFSDSTLIWYLAGKYEASGLEAAPLVFSNETLAWAMRKSDANLLESVNSALKKLMASGELKRTLLRWIPKFE